MRNYLPSTLLFFVLACSASSTDPVISDGVGGTVVAHGGSSGKGGSGGAKAQGGAAGKAQGGGGTGGAVAGAGGTGPAGAGGTSPAGAGGTGPAGAGGTGPAGAGGAPSTCDFNSTIPACESCLKGPCLATCTACSDNAECMTLYNCLKACSTQSCVKQCGDAHPNGINDFNAFLGTSGCLELNCKSQCSGGGGSGGGGTGGTGGTPATGNVLFLNFDGANLVKGAADDATKNISQIGGGTIPPFPGTAAEKAKVVSIVQDVYKEFNITIVTTRPSSGNYEMAMIGGEGANVGQGDYPGISPLDCGNANKRNISFIFAAHMKQTSTQMLGDRVGETTSHETGHIFGLPHSNEACDMMVSPFDSYCAAWYRTFMNKQMGIPNDGSPTCGMSTTNSWQLLANALGLK